MEPNNNLDQKLPKDESVTEFNPPKPAVSETVAQATQQIVTNPNQTKVSSHMAMSIISLFFFWPFSIFAIIYASKVNTLVAQNDVSGAQLASKRAKKWSLWAYGIWLALFLTLLLSISLVSYVGITERATVMKVTENELSYISDGNSDAAYNLTSSEFKDANTKTEFDVFVSTYKSFPLKTAEKISYNLDTESSTKSTANLIYSLTKDGQKYDINTNLVKLNGKWSVQNIYISPRDTSSVIYSN